MKSVLRVLTASAVVCGSVIGAGFMSGNEIWAFFSGASAVSVFIMTFVMFAGAVFIFLRAPRALGAADSETLFKSLFGKGRFIADYAVLLCYFLVLSTMLAAANLTVCQIIGINPAIPLFSTLSALVCGFVLWHGMAGIKAANIVVVPLSVAFIIMAVLLPHGDGGPAAAQGAFGGSVMYVALNGLLSVCVLLALGGKLSKGECAATSLFSAAALSVLIALIIKKLNASPFAGDALPLLSLAKAEGGAALHIFGVCVLYLSAMTSVCCNAYPIILRVQSMVKNKFVSVSSVLFAAVLFSIVGFEMILRFSRPVMCALGALLIITVYIKLCVRGAVRRAPLHLMQKKSSKYSV